MLMDVTLLNNRNNNSSDAPIVEPDSDDVKIKDVSVDENGELNYEIAEGKTATLTEILSGLTSDQLAEIKKLEINDQITELSNASLTQLTGLETLDLTGASGLPQNTELNLSDVTAENVTMSGNDKITSLTLSEGSTVKNIDAGGSGLTAITLAGNDTIETLNVNNTRVSSINASGCESLKSLKASETGATLVNVEGCESLEELDVSKNILTSINLQDCTNLETLYVYNNRLLILDLSGLDNLKEDYCDWSNQSNYDFFKPSKTFDLVSFIFARIMANLNVSSSDIAANIGSIVEVSSSDKEVQSSKYDPATGIATFSRVPTGSLRYYYNVFGGSSVNVDSVLPADIADLSSMDVTLTANENDPENDSGIIGPSGAGCNNTVSDEDLGLRNLLALSIFAFAFMKRKRG